MHEKNSACQKLRKGPNHWLNDTDRSTGEAYYVDQIGIAWSLGSQKWSSSSSISSRMTYFAATFVEGVIATSFVSSWPFSSFWYLKKDERHQLIKCNCKNRNSWKELWVTNIEFSIDRILYLRLSVSKDNTDYYQFSLVSDPSLLEKFSLLITKLNRKAFRFHVK